MQEHITVQKLPKMPSYQPLAKIPSLNAEIVVAQWSLPISTGVVSQVTDLHPSQVYAYSLFAEHLAIGLAHTLNVLENYDKSAVHRIMSILEPYIEEIPEPNFTFPPISSTRIIAKVIDRGTAEPDFYLE